MVGHRGDREGRASEGVTVDWTTCPDLDCGRIAEVVDDYECESTNGPVRHVASMCVLGHHYVTAVDPDE